MSITRTISQKSNIHFSFFPPPSIRLGHNMGLGHAGENDEYDDQVGFMGYR